MSKLVPLSERKSLGDESIDRYPTINAKEENLRADTELKRVRKQQEELKLDVMRGELISKKEHDAILAKLSVNCRNKLLSIPSKLAPKLAASSDRVEIQSILDSQIREALEELSSDG